MALVKIIASAFIFHKASSAFILSRNIIPLRQTISKSLLFCQHRRFGPQVSRAFSKCWMSTDSQPSADENSNVLSSIEDPAPDASFDAIPSIEQLRTDPFMKQVTHAEFIVALIAEDAGRNSDVLLRRLRAQLSHPDGIRGFMITFLTSKTPYDSNEENDTIPNSLLSILLEQIDPSGDGNKLISLMCKNVIMPTAMKTQQTTEELSQQSAFTANRAMRLLKHVLRQCKDLPGQLSYKTLIDECQAILSAATETNWNENDFCRDAKQATWNDFFTKWGYESRQLSDIAAAMRSVLQE